jgi:hypothetical protein
MVAGTVYARTIITRTLPSVRVTSVNGQALCTCGLPFNTKSQCNTHCNKHVDDGSGSLITNDESKEVVHCPANYVYDFD